MSTPSSYHIYSCTHLRKPKLRNFARLVKWLKLTRRCSVLLQLIMQIIKLPKNTCLSKWNLWTWLTTTKLLECWRVCDTIICFTATEPLRCYIGSIIKCNKYSKWDGTVYSDSVCENRVYNLSTMHMHSTVKSQAHYITLAMANNVGYLSAYWLHITICLLHERVRPAHYRAHMYSVSLHTSVSIDILMPKNQLKRMTGRHSNAGDIQWSLEILLFAFWYWNWPWRSPPSWWSAWLVCKLCFRISLLRRGPFSAALAV